MKAQLADEASGWGRTDLPRAIASLGGRPQRRPSRAWARRPPLRRRARPRPPLGRPRQSGGPGRPGCRS
eukprot:15445275-Alexandrium_andersonii.AAC.1